MHGHMAVLLAGFVTIGAGMASCASGRRPASGNQPMTTAQPRVELLGFPGCPDTPAMRDNLRAALKSISTGWTFIDTDQETLPEHDPRRGWPIPTVLVNGRDLFGMPSPAGSSMGCRVYPGGVPGAGEIAERLRAAAGAR